MKKHAVTKFGRARIGGLILAGVFVQACACAQVSITKTGGFDAGRPVGGVALSPDGARLYAALWEDDNGSRILELRLPDLQLLQAIPYGSYHTHGDVVVSADGCRLFTQNYYPATVSQVNLCGGNARTDLSTWQSWPADINITPDGCMVVVSVGQDGQPWDQNNDGIAIYDICGGGLSALGFVPLNDDPESKKLGFSADSQYAYVTTRARKSPYPRLCEVSLRSRQVTRTMDFAAGGAWPLRGVACQGDRVFVSDHSNAKVWVVDRGSWTATGYAMPSTPGTLAMHPNGRHLFALLREAQAVVAIDTQTMAVVGRYDGLQVEATDIEFGAGGTKMYVSHRSPAGGVFVFDVGTAPECHTLYVQDFSSDPGWTKDDPNKLRWDSGTGTFHGTQVNTEGTYAYINLPAFNPNNSWRLEWDHIINSDDWSAGLTFGLFDSRLLYPFAAGMDMSIGDMGHGTALIYNGSAEGQFSPAWSPGIWYHSMVEYNATNGQLTLTVMLRSTGNLLLTQTRTVPSFPASLTRLGVSRLMMRNTGPGASPTATVDYSLDNIRLCQAQAGNGNGAPAVACPPAAVVECGAETQLTVQVSDPEGDAMVVVWFLNGAAIQTNLVPASAPGTPVNVSLSGSFPLGTNLLAVGVTDGTNVASCSTTITVVDTTPPVISNVAASPNVLWPPNRQMVRVNIRAAITDACGAGWRIIRVRSNEPVTGRGAGNRSADWVITGDHTLLLRAERSGHGSGRVYYITVQATDAAGNVSQTQTVTVTVPRSRWIGRSPQTPTPAVPAPAPTPVVPQPPRLIVPQPATPVAPQLPTPAPLQPHTPVVPQLPRPIQPPSPTLTPIVPQSPTLTLPRSPIPVLPQPSNPRVLPSQIVSMLSPSVPKAPSPSR